MSKLFRYIYEHDRPAGARLIEAVDQAARDADPLPDEPAQLPKESRAFDEWKQRRHKED